MPLSQDFESGSSFDPGRISLMQLRVFALCAIVSILDGLDSISIGSVGSLLAKDLGLGAAALGAVFSIAQVGAVVGALVFGPLADRIGRKPTIMISVAIITVATLATAQSGSLSTLLLSRLIAGVGLAGALPPAMALSSEYAPHKLRGTIVSAVFAGYPLGAAMGGFLTAYIVNYYDWRAVFYLGTLLPLIALGVLAIFLPESITYLTSKGQKKRAEALFLKFFPGRSISNLEPTPSLKTQGTSEKATRIFAGALKAPTLFLISIYFCAFATTKVMGTWFPNLLNRGGLDVSTSAVGQGLFEIGTTLGMVISGAVVDRFGPFRSLTPTFLLSAICLLLFAILPIGRETAFLLAGSTGLFIGIGGSGANAVAARIFEPRIRSTGMGFGLASARLGQVISPMLIASLITLGITPQRIFPFIAILPLCASLAVFGLHVFLHGVRPTRSPAESPPNSVHTVSNSKRTQSDQT